MWFAERYPVWRRSSGCCAPLNRMPWWPSAAEPSWASPSVKSSSNTTDGTVRPSVAVTALATSSFTVCFSLRVIILLSPYLHLHQWMAKRKIVYEADHAVTGAVWPYNPNIHCPPPSLVCCGAWHTTADKQEGRTHRKRPQKEERKRWCCSCKSNRLKIDSLSWKAQK